MCHVHLYKLPVIRKRVLMTASTHCSSVKACPTGFSSCIIINIYLKYCLVETLGHLQYELNLIVSFLILVAKVSQNFSLRASHISWAIYYCSYSHKRSSHILLSNVMQVLLFLLFQSLHASMSLLCCAVLHTLWQLNRYIV